MPENSRGSKIPDRWLLGNSAQWFKAGTKKSLRGEEQHGQFNNNKQRRQNTRELQERNTQGLGFNKGHSTERNRLNRLMDEKQVHIISSQCSHLTIFPPDCFPLGMWHVTRLPPELSRLRLLVKLEGELWSQKCIESGSIFMHSFKPRTAPFLEVVTG